MVSLGKYDMSEDKKAMWLYPKLVGSNPSERWGHTSCFSQGHVYVFGGCCGGMHFSDVLVLNLDTMSWANLVTTGNGPGPRDSHSATVWRNSIIVFGGTNGFKKVNDLHILDLDSKEWVQPLCSGASPTPRESHTATLVGDDQLVVFGGSGEGVGNYLNDLHFLDLKTMTWTSPVVKGNPPPPRDSHISVAVGRKVFVYGGDCGDRYHGDVDVFDMDNLMWSRLEIHGPSPGRRAGHAAVRIETKVYVIGGVGDKKYYNDAWVLDTTVCSWSKLNICGQPPQGRFSHTAVATYSNDIAIYGGCGEDERPLGQLLILQLGDEHPNGRYNISLCKSFGNHRSQRKRRGQLNAQWQKTMLLGSCIETERKDGNEIDVQHTKKRMTWDKEPEQEEHSLSVSQNSSHSQSDQEQTTALNPTSSLTIPQGPQFPPSMNQPNKTLWKPQQNLPDVYILGENRPNGHNQRHGHTLPLSHAVRSEVEFLTADGRHLNQNVTQNLIGADVLGKVDGSFDSGYLMTATVNGRTFRGVLFAPGSNIMNKGPSPSQNSLGHIPTAHPSPNSNRGSVYRKSPIFQPIKNTNAGLSHELCHGSMDRSSPMFRALPSKDRELRNRSDLQGVVLTLGGPGSSHV